MTSAGRPLHLLSVWNPSYSDDALDRHLEILIRWARAAEAGEADPETDVYVWWAKIRSRNREGPLPHRRQVTALDAQVRAGVETHLYLTDYRSLYVGHVGEVTDEDIRSWEGELEHAPAYVREHAVDFWFRLFDLRRLVSDDTPAVIEELRHLRNTRYQDRPVSLYGGIVELPLVVFRHPPVSWFGDREALAGGRLWAEQAAAYRSEAARISTQIRDNLLGRELWPVLHPGTRTFLASAEAVFRARRDDPGFDVGGAAVEYAKALETELNDLLFHALSRAAASWPQPDRVLHVDGRPLDLSGPVAHQTLGVLRNLLLHEARVRKGVGQQLPADASWLLGTLPRHLARLADVRNPGAHAAAVGGGELRRIRATLMGVGEEGVFARLARAKLRALGRRG